MKDYYKILGLSNTSDILEIKKRFRELALKWHPDKNKSFNAESIFIEIHEAYQFLSDPEKRKLYDELVNQQKNQDTFQSGSIQSKFNVYHKNVSEAREKAKTFSKMSFKKYAKLMFNVLDEVQTGIANIIGFVFGFGFFLDGILLLVIAVLYFSGKKTFVMDAALDLIWILPLAFALIFIGDILFYEPICKLLGIRNRWWKIPIFKRWNNK